MLTKEEVLHVAALARLSMREDEVELYQKQLTDIMTEIDKIVDADIKENKMTISPIENKNCYSIDNIGTMINRKEILKNAPNKDEEYIIVPEVIHD